MDPEDVKRVIQQVFPRKQPILTGDALRGILAVADIYTLCGVLKWCWARLPGGVITWKVYEKYKSDEKRNREHDALITLLPRCVESPLQQNIILDFLTLLMKIAEKEKKNGLNGRKLARLAGFWAFDLVQPNKETPTSFGEGLACWSVAAEATYHMFLARIRTQFPKPGTGKLVSLPKILETMLLSEPYPPKPLYKTRLTTVPKITLLVGRLSSDPLVLLQRVAKTIQLSDSSKFASIDEYQTLNTLFHSKEDIELRMSVESRRILEEISRANGILATDHNMMIKDTVNLSYDVRCKTWSKFYNNAFIDPVTGDLHRPLTNYVYPPNYKTRIEQSQRPYSERPTTAYPPTPELHYSQPLRAETWKNAKDYYEITQDNKQYANLEAWHHQRKVEEQHRVSCILSHIEIDDFFAWVWMSSLSPEQTEVRKAMFGRSVVVEVPLYEGKAGRRWVVVEEVLVPKPSPMRPKINTNDMPFEYTTSSAHAKIAAPKPKEKKQVKLKPPVKVKEVKPPPPRPKATPIVQMPEPEPLEQEFVEEEDEQDDEGTTIKIFYENMDPLVAAVAERLKKQNKDTQTQTETTQGTQTDPLPENEESISADTATAKGVQTDDLEEPAMSNVPYQDTVQDIDISASPSAEPAPRKLRPSASFEEVINAIPYLHVDSSTGDDLYVTPILTSAPVFPQRAPATINVPKRRKAGSPPTNAEHFVVPIDSSHEPGRRVVSMPAFSSRPDASRHREPDQPDQYRPDKTQFQPHDAPRRIASSYNAVPRSMHQPSTADIQARQAMEDGLWQGNRQPPQHHEGPPRHSGNMQRPAGFRDDSPNTSDGSSNLRINWSSGRENSRSVPRGRGPSGRLLPQLQETGMDSRDPRSFEGGAPDPGFHQVPRDFHNDVSCGPNRPQHPGQARNHSQPREGSNPPHPYRTQVDATEDPAFLASLARPDNFKDDGYGSDSYYRYEPNDRAQASPDSGYARFPVQNSQQKFTRNMAGDRSNPVSDGEYSNKSATFPQSSFHSPALGGSFPLRSGPDSGSSLRNDGSSPFRNAVEESFREEGMNLGGPSKDAGADIFPSDSASNSNFPPPSAPIAKPSTSSPRVPHQSFKTHAHGMDLQSTSSGNSQNSKWSEVRSTLSAMSTHSRGTGDQPKLPLPAVIEAKSNPKDPVTVRSLFGVTAPEDYMDATVNMYRRPSINTGDHVKNIMVKDNFNSEVIGRLPSATTFEIPAQPAGPSKPPVFTREIDGANAFFDDVHGPNQDEDDSDNDFTMAFPPNKHNVDIYAHSPPPLPKHSARATAAPARNNELYQSTHQGLRGAYNIEDPGMLLAQENARRSVSSGAALPPTASTFAAPAPAPARRLSLLGRKSSKTHSAYVAPPPPAPAPDPQPTYSAGGMGGLSRSYTGQGSSFAGQARPKQSAQNAPRQVSRFSIAGIVNAVSEKKKKNGQ